MTNTKTFTNYSTKFKTDNYEHFLFPDAVILTEENSSVNNYMLHIQKEVGLNSRCLSKSEIIGIPSNTTGSQGEERGRQRAGKEKERGGK